MSIIQQFRMSFRSLKNVRVIAGTALFCALYMALSSFTIYLTPTLRITFSYLAVAASCSFYGLVPNLLAAVITDFLGWVLVPSGPYFPGYILNALVQAAVYAWFFYGKDKVSVKSVLAARAIVVVVNYLVLNPLWLSILYGQSFQVLAAARILKNVILFPVDCVLLYLVLGICARIRKSGRV